MKINAERIAQLINGKVEGDKTVEVSSFGKIEEAKEGQLAFLANLKYEGFFILQRRLQLSLLMKDRN
jgi:UDP-3-O-[3-hydroxymyristoyl] glucosamine N-acyltransferase